MASRGPPDASATNFIVFGDQLNGETSWMCHMPCATGMSYLISLNPMHLKDIAHVSSFEQIVLLYVHICVFLRECHIWYPWIPCLNLCTLLLPTRLVMDPAATFSDLEQSCPYILTGLPIQLAPKFRKIWRSVPTFCVCHFFYTDISIISVTFHNSGGRIITRLMFE